MARGDRQFARINVSGILKRLESVEEEARRANQDMQMELAEAGRDKMREIIETSGTGNTWSAPHFAKDYPRSGSLRTSSGPGRVNTGNMRDSVSVRFEGGPSRVTSAFGWIRNFEDYFGYQDNSFYHKKASNTKKHPGPYTVPGMFALRDARRYAVEQVLPRLIRKYQNRITRRYYE